MSESSLVPSGHSHYNGAAAQSRYAVPWSAHGGYPGYEGAEGTGFREQLAGLLDLLVRRRATLAILFVGVIAVVAIMTFTATPKYEASSWVLLDTDPGAARVTPIGAGSENLQFVNSQRSVAGEILLLEISNGLAVAVGERLIELEVIPGTRQKLTVLDFDDASESESPSVTPAMVAHRLSRYTAFEQESPEANVIRITATSPVAGEAALIANLYADEYVKLTREANRAHLSASRQFLEEQEEKWKAELYDAEEAVRDLGGSDGTGTLDQRGAFLVDQVAGLEAERDRTSIDIQIRRASLGALERQLQQVSSQLAGSIASSVEQEMEVVRTRIADLEIRRKEILFRYPTLEPSEIDSPELRAIESQIAQLRSDLDDLSFKYVAEIEAAGGVAGGDGLGYITNLRQRIADERIAIDGMEAQLRTVERRLGGYTTQLGGLPDRSLRVARVERTRQHAAQMYESVVGKLQEVLIAEQSEPGYARIVREAGVPRTPTEPNVIQNLILALLLGVLLGGIGVVAVDKIDNRLYKPESFEDSGLDVVALVPNMRPLIDSRFGGKETAEIDGVQVSSALVGLVEPSSAIAEAYRHLRTFIQFSGGSKLVRRTLVTSSNMAEGKSVTAANLAIVMAQAGRRTLLIDGDLRRPRVHKMFGYDIGPGLATLLMDGDTDEAESAFRKTSVSNLSILTAGRTVEEPSSILSSRKLRELLDVLAETYDHVVIDSPPIRAANDAVLLSTQCDGTLLVVRAGKTRGPELTLAKKHLDDVGANILGVLFNAFDVSMAYGYTYKYSDYEEYATYTTYSYADEDNKSALT